MKHIADKVETYRGFTIRKCGEGYYWGNGQGYFFTLADAREDVDAYNDSFLALGEMYDSPALDAPWYAYT